MTKKKKVEKVEPTEEEETLEEEATPGKEKAPEVPKGAKLYDVFDGSGELLNIYTSKEVANAFAAKVDGRKVVPSPKGRTREDVAEAIKRLKAMRLKNLEKPGPAV